MLISPFFTTIFVLLALNIFAFIFVGIDKQKSTKPGAERFSEVSFFFLATLFSALGIFFGMLAFRHKTRKFYFLIGMALLVIEQAALMFLLADWYARK